MPTLLNLVQRVRPAPVQVFLLDLLRANRRQVIDSDGLRFFVDPTSHLGHRMLTATMEPELTEQLRNHLGPGDTFLDLGANEGYFSVLASRIVGPTGRVVAVEPQRRLGPIILKNLMLNNCMNCVLVQCVVTDRNGEAVLNLSPSTNTGSTSLFPVQKYRVKHEAVASLTLENLLLQTGVSRFDMVKIDIEGAEFSLSMAAREILKQGSLRVVALEVHSRVLAKLGFSEATLHQLFLDSGYSVVTEYPRDAEKLVVYRHRAA